MLKNFFSKSKSCDHVQLSGMAFYDEGKCFMFAPNDAVPERVVGYRRQGVAQQLSDGSFEFVAMSSKRSQSKQICKLAHGRASETKDGAVQLTLKVFMDEGVNISETIRRESREACEAIRNYQLRR